MAEPFLLLISAGVVLAMVWLPWWFAAEALRPPRVSLAPARPSRSRRR